MDHETMLAHPLAAVFGRLAAPPRLGDWLPEVTGVQAGAAPPAGIGTEFGLRLRRGGQEVPGTGELIAYEPPWLVAYRLAAGPDTHVLRVTCTSTSAGTRVHIRQAGPAHPLAVSLPRLRRALAAAPGDSPHTPPGQEPAGPSERKHR